MPTSGASSASCATSNGLPSSPRKASSGKRLASTGLASIIARPFGGCSRRRSAMKNGDALQHATMRGSGERWVFGTTHLLTIIGLLLTAGIAAFGFRSFDRWNAGSRLLSEH
jgi:hypothetical protein